MKKRRNWVFELTLAGVAIAIGVGFSLRPWRAYLEQRAVRDETRLEMQDAEKRSEELVRAKARSDSALGREEEARRQGYRRPGELPLGAAP